MQFIFGDKGEAIWLIRECPTCDWKKGEGKGEYEYLRAKQNTPCVSIFHPRADAHIPGVDFLYDCRSANVIEIALSKKNNFAVRHSPNICATKRCEKVRRHGERAKVSYEKSTPGHLPGNQMFMTKWQAPLSSGLHIEPQCQGFIRHNPQN